MNDAPFVSGVQRIGDLTGKRERGRQRKRTADDPVGQCLSVNKFHHQGRHALAVFDAVNGRDVGMIDGGEDACLALEALHPVRV